MDRICLRSVLLSLLTGCILYGQPTINSISNVSNSGTSLAPGGIAYVSGYGLSTDNASAPNTTTVVTVGGINAYVQSETGYQLIVQIPVDAPPSTPIFLTVNGTSQIPITLAQYAPAFFPAGSFVQGTHQDGSAVSSSAPALPGEVISVYATGLGPTNPPAATGVVPTGSPETATLPVVTLGGAPTTVLSCALAGIGLYQISFVVPADTPPGSQTISTAIGGVTSSLQSLPVNSVLANDTFVVGTAGGTSSVELFYYGPWTATSNSSFLHVSAGSASGTGNGLVVFTYDAFTGAGARTGTLTIAGDTVTVTQAGTNYITPGEMYQSYQNVGPGQDYTGCCIYAEWGGSVLTTFAGINPATAEAVDGAGNSYTLYTNKVQVYGPHHPPSEVFAQQVDFSSMTVDVLGDIYLLDRYHSALLGWSASTQQLTTLVSFGLNQPMGVAVDHCGNVYIADTLNNAIKEWSPATQQVTTLVSEGLYKPQELAVDSSGNVYIANTFNSAVKEWSPVTQQVTTLVSANYPQSVAVDRAGNVYIASDTLEILPNAFIGPATLTEHAGAGTDSLLPMLALPSLISSNFVMAYGVPSWLTVGAIADGVVNFSFTANTTGSPRLADLEVMSQAILVNQNAFTAQTISFGTLPDQPFGTAPFTVSATATSGLTVSFDSTTPTCSVSGNTVTLISGGICTIQAAQTGNNDYGAATPVNQSFQITQESQTITFGPLSNQPYGAAPFAVTATATSGLTVSFGSLTPATCSMSGNIVTLVGAGTCTIQATQAGNSDYSGATPVNQSFQITGLSQTISFGPLLNQPYGTTPFALTATATSGLTVSLVSLTPATCSMSGNIVTIVGAGTCTIQATQAGAGAYTAATPVNQSFLVTQLSQSISFPPIDNQTYGAPPLSVSATATSGLAVSFWSRTPAVCTTNGTTVYLVAAGTCTIGAMQSGNTDYTAAPLVFQTFLISKETQIISFGSLSNKLIGTAPFALSATSSSGLPVSFTSTTAAICTISGTTVTLAALGTCTIQALQWGDNYYATATVNQSFQVVTWVSITTTSLNSGQVGAAYSQTLMGTSVTGVYIWSVISGRLPAGLSLNSSTGAISGTPAQAATTNLTFQLADSATPLHTATLAFALTVQTRQPVSITTTSIGGGIAGSSYSQTLTAAGGQIPYTWSIAPGNLPGGLSLGASTGVISGTPTVSVSNLSLTFQVTDSSAPPQTATATLTLTIGSRPAFSITATSLPDANVGVSYTQQLSTTGGSGPYFWSAAGLPASLSINPSTGAITGTPSAAGTSTVSITVTDSSTPQQIITKNFTLTVQTAAAPLTITSTSLAAGQAGVAYSQALTATGGTAPYTWSVISGRLPGGLSLNSATGVISGMAASSFTSVVEFQVTDSSSPAKTATVSLSITIN